MLLGLAVIVQGLFALQRRRVGAGAARRRHAAAVHRRRARLELRRPAARVGRRATRPRARRRCRASGRRQLRPEHQPHRGHGSGVDDRPRADRLRRDPRRRAAQLDQGRAGQAGQGRLRAHPEHDRKRFVPGPDGVGPGQSAGVQVVSAVRSDRANVFGASTTVAGVDPATIGRVYRFAWKQRLGRRSSHTWATARSSTRATRPSTICRSEAGSRFRHRTAPRGR